MSVGTVVSVYDYGSAPYATVRDEYGSSYNVPASSLDQNAEAGDEFAYRVRFTSSHGSNQTLEPVD